VADFVRVLALSGARFSEVKSLLWADLETDRIYLPNSKGGPRTIWLGDAARHVLSSRPRRGPHVFQNAGKPVSGITIRNEWSLIRKRAKLPGLRLHDLRHSFASVAVCQGTSLRTIRGLLGHKRLDATQSYSHLAKAPLKASARRVASGMERKLSVGRTRRTNADRRSCVSVSPLQAPECEMDRLFLKSGSTLPPFCVEHGLN
jgi:integrase